VAIWEKAPISEPLRMAYSLQNLAETLAELRDSGAARPPMHRALAIFERVLGSEHPDSARALIALAGMQWQAGDSAGALEHSLSAEAAARRHFRATARGLAEREALRLEEIRSSGLDLALSILARPGASGAPSSAIARAFEEVVRSRGMVLDEMAARHRAAVEHEEAETASLSRALEAVRTRLSRLAVEGARPGREQEYSARLHSLREEKERAERALADRSAAFSRELEDQRAGLAGIAAALPPETALVSILQYRQRNSPVETERKTEGIPSYVAFVLAPGHRSPVLTSLGPARPLEALIARWKEEASASRHGRILAPEATEARFREAGEAVRQALWDPLQKHVGQAKYVFLVPDGALHLLNLATLPAEDGRYLIETGPIIHYLTAERDLLRRREPSRPGAGMLVLGAPDFDAPPQPAGAVLAAGVPPRLQAARYRSRRAACADFRSLRFQPLPESLREAEEVEALWKRAEVADAARDSGVLKLTGARAREDDFKRQVTGHRIVHLATHGFFAGDRCASTLEGTLVPAPSELLADSPLLLTGLALAGANRREAVGVDAEDGILTAEEIASLDLTGVEWAVLSACETGAGPVQNGEGVLGLRRAFEMAGAGTLIMSLWSVEDTAAREWMGGLYEGRFRGLSTAEAVREASLKMIRARRQSGRSTHPASWGAFVAAGDWR
jgi:CHAT domain-containing protein